MMVNTMETFGLTKQVPGGSVEDVNAALAANTAKIMGVVNALVSGVDDLLLQNAEKLQNIANRLVNSVNGHLRKNAGLLKPIGNELVNHVNSALADNQAILNMTLADPAVAPLALRDPALATYLPSTAYVPPDAPTETAQLPAAAMRAAALPPPPLPDQSQTWTIFFHCGQGMVAIVPDGALVGPYTGWRPGPPWAGGDGFTGSRTQVIEYLEKFGPQMFRAACPNSTVQV